MFFFLQAMTKNDEKNTRMALLGGDVVLPSRTSLSMVTFTTREVTTDPAPWSCWAATR
jgi:hypothetical protein